VSRMRSFPNLTSYRSQFGSLSVPQPNELQVAIRFFARIEHARRIESWETVAGLECFHVLKESVIQGRFDDGRASGVHAAFVRVFRLDQNWILPNEKSYAGCRSWVELPDPPATMRLEPVLGDVEHAEIEKRFLRTIEFS
jgi:hypothetical protein